MQSAYVKDLVWQLTLRDAADEEILAAVHQVNLRESRGEDPAAELGSAAEYAATFSGQRPSPARSRWVTVAGILAVAWLIGTAVAVERFGFDPPVPDRLFALLGALLLLCVGVGVAFVAALSRARRATARIATH
ncbi:hypothetical protein GCM10025872_36130 [Barrientosiimonas endolithica]|uniref:DUF1707 domain-containing protein n=1 Tax=Barrientosiimonas endolithica TaxID=1535208 RepID=A0ABN6YX77_9MICO|nr:hypothetical protein GCM10025872_36130 [Barrientosiimonas endolithica]